MELLEIVTQSPAGLRYGISSKSVMQWDSVIMAEEEMDSVRLSAALEQILCCFAEL